MKKLREIHSLKKETASLKHEKKRYLSYPGGIKEFFFIVLFFNVSFMKLNSSDTNKQKNKCRHL